MSITVSAGNSAYDVAPGSTDTGDSVVAGGSMFVPSGGEADLTARSSSW